MIISGLVLTGFTFVTLFAMNKELPIGSAAILNVVIGTLSAMAASVVAYWVGSTVSSGSQTAQSAALAQSSTASVPPAIAQALAASVPAAMAHDLVRQAGAAAAARAV